MTIRNTRIPTNQIECLAKYLHLGRRAFRETFYAQFGKELGMLTNNRSSYLWEKQEYFLKELGRIQEVNHTVMVPARIVNKAIPGETRKPAGMGDRLDIDELMVKQNNLLAEIVVLQKEQIAIGNAVLELFKKAKGVSE